MNGPYTKPNKAPEIEALNWQLVESLSDEFNDNHIDLTKWQLQPRANGWVWIGRPPGLFKAENVTEAEGNLNVEVSVLPNKKTIENKEFLYQGAIVRSLEAGQPGWYYETRMKANATEMSSTFWLMTKGNTVKKLELDIQECVGKRSDNAADWSKGWDQIFHSNSIHRTNQYNPDHIQIEDSVTTKTKNHERYYVYAAWWKSETEVRFYLDGEYVYSITPPIGWDVPAFIHMAIETYDWNPVPQGGGMIKTGNKEQRTTSYDWVRVWQIKPEAN
ncbi:glycosyl hydrolase [Catenovulum maritimum]|uniref:Glycosyl hydrolase n=1 Tax=Catenovulum maritimum TaxID=1513271 RepID=A0A0J8JQM4_9ALTE|nr:glycosyl hydrolase [Catenovulum maritimum]